MITNFRLPGTSIVPTRRQPQPRRSNELDLREGSQRKLPPLSTLHSPSCRKSSPEITFFSRKYARVINKILSRSNTRKERKEKNLSIISEKIFRRNYSDNSDNGGQNRAIKASKTVCWLRKKRFVKREKKPRRDRFVSRAENHKRGRILWQPTLTRIRLCDQVRSFASPLSPRRASKGRKRSGC